MKKNGFTLIELLAVIALLALIASVVFPAINSAITSSKEKAYNDQVATIERAAKQWAVDNYDVLPELGSEEQPYPLSLDTLVDSGYISEDKVIDPRDNTPMDGTVKITAGTKQYTYIYEE